MAQNTGILCPSPHYTRADFTALRAWLNRLPLPRIAELYYCVDDLEQLGGSDGLRRRLHALRDALMQRARERNPELSTLLSHARQSGACSAKLVDFLLQATERQDHAPRRQDSIGLWFKPRLATSLNDEGIRHLNDLLLWIDLRGSGWWKPIPRLGAGKAEAIMRWLEKSGIGFIPPKATERQYGAHVLLDADCLQFIALERIALPGHLDGSQGSNRHPVFPLLAARNDLQAMDAYLYKFRAQPKTGRAYRKELERFLLWCIYARKQALSSTHFEDCEAYKNFLGAPPAHWVGRRAARLSGDWRPFAGTPSITSQRYAVQTLRTFFAWLVDVRYLGGNPWKTVADPNVARPVLPLQIDKALSARLWEKLSAPGGLLDRLCACSDAELQACYPLRGWAKTMPVGAQFRLLRAALLLLGDAGLRRSEAALACRDKLRPTPGTDELWELDVLGKRHKWRTVFLPQRTVNAIAAHWRDRARDADFDFGMQTRPLLAPLFIPATASSQARHGRANGTRQETGFSPDGLYQAIKAGLRRLAADSTLRLDVSIRARAQEEQHGKKSTLPASAYAVAEEDVLSGFVLDENERAALRQAGPHAFRHTFGTQAVAHAVPLDVVQKILGHASLQTTTLYVQAEKKRSREEMGLFFTQRAKTISGT